MYMLIVIKTNQKILNMKNHTLLLFFTILASVVLAQDRYQGAEKGPWDLPTVYQHFKGASINYMSQMKCTLHCEPTVDCETFSHVKESSSTSAPVGETTSGSPAPAAPNTPKPALICPNATAYNLDTKYTITSNKSAAQSSTWGDTSHTAQKAIDNDNSTFSHTSSKDVNPWWRIDLYEPYLIVGFSIRNHNSAELLHYFEVRVGSVDPVSSPSNLSGNPLCYFHPDAGIGSFELYTRNCSEPLLGQYLSIQIVKYCSSCTYYKDENYLVMPEVYIYGCKL